MNATHAISTLVDRSSRRFEGFKQHWGTSIDVICLAFPVVFLFGTAALETAQPGYNRITDTISELVWGQSGWIENALFIVFAFALSVFALRIRAAFVPLLMAAIGFVIIAIFPTEAPGAPLTLVSLIHLYTAQGIALALPFACFCLAYKLQSSEENNFIVICSVTAGTIGLILNLAGFMAIYGQTEWIGAAERLVMFNGLAWLQILSAHLYLTGRKAGMSCKSNTGSKGLRFSTTPDRSRVQPVRVPVTTPSSIYTGRRLQ